MIETRIEPVGIEEIRRRLGSLEDKAPFVLANAINRALTNVRKNMGKQTAARYNITAGEVRKSIKITQADKRKLQGIVRSRASPIALVKFKVSPDRRVDYSSGRPSPEVYMASVEKGGADKPLDGNPKSFIAVMRSGHKGVFTRTGRSKGLTRQERRTVTYNSKSRADRGSRHEEIIRQNYGPSIPQMIKNEESMEVIRREAQSMLEKRIEAQIEYLLGKGAAK